jgi:hypothetical protein
MINNHEEQLGYTGEKRPTQTPKGCDDYNKPRQAIKTPKG